jgi:putative transposase
LLAFYDLPAEHWHHLRTTNPIESVFATVRHWTVRTKGSLSSKTARLMGENQLPKLVNGVRFQDGIDVIPMSSQSAA